MNSDGQHNPAGIPKLIAHILEGEANIVNVSHCANGHNTDTVEYRYIGRTILDKITIMDYENCRRRVR